MECQAEQIKELGGESLTVLLDDEGRRWLIGVQLAAALNKETFNMYASMKLKGVVLLRAKPDHVEWLAGHGAIKGSTHSVTLVPYEAGLAYIQGVLKSGGGRKARGAARRQRRKRANSRTMAQGDFDEGEGGMVMEEERQHEDEDDSDDFSDDVMQPTKRQRSGAASTAASRRSFSRQLDELLLGASSSSSSRPSYRLSVMPALQQQSRFASARFIPTQATLPPSFEEEEERTVRRVPRWPSSTVTRKVEPPKPAKPRPRRPLHVSRRKPAPWQVMRAIPKSRLRSLQMAEEALR